jgi:uncharacterized phage-associated protein
MPTEPKFDKAKFEELIVYFARRLRPEAALGHVKLMKLLMLADFTAYLRTGEAITGATYEKWEHGHFPREWVMAEKDLDARAIRQETVNYYGKKLQHVTALRDPDMSRFTEEQIAIAETTLRRYGYESATYLRGLSHQEIGWKLAELREEIPYNTVFLGTGGAVTEEDVRRGEELASSYGWN